MTERLSLTQDGVEMVNYPTQIRSNVARAATAWQDFIMLDQHLKERFAAASLQSGTGYEKKGSGQRESRDMKRISTSHKPASLILTQQLTTTLLPHVLYQRQVNCLTI